MNTYTPPKINRRVFIYLGILIGVGGLLIYLSIFFPTLFNTIINFLWIMMLIAVAIFLVLGFLVIIGLKEEVSSFLDVLLEGSLTIIDAVEFLKKLYVRFIEVLKDFIYFISPVRKRRFIVTAIRSRNSQDFLIIGRNVSDNIIIFIACCSNQNTA